MLKGFSGFRARFQFRPEWAGLVSVERECFLTRGGKVVPIAPEVLAMTGINGRFGYELSACQLEDRVGPHRLDEVAGALSQNDRLLERAEAELGFKRLFAEVGPEDMPLDVYPDPAGRYARITKRLPQSILKAACRVAGIHIHVGMPDRKTARLVFNAVIGEWRRLLEMGDGSFGERFQLYQTMAPKFDPPHLSNWEEFHRIAMAEGFDRDPRQCYWLIRISPHGTIEFRTFGTTADNTKTAAYATVCRDLCSQAIATLAT